MEVSTSASSVAQSLRARPGMLSGPAALRGLIFLSALCTTADETVGGGGGLGGPSVCVPPLCIDAGGLKAGIESVEVIRQAV